MSQMATLPDCIRAINQAGGAIRTLDDRITRLEDQLARLSDLLGVLIEQLDGRGLIEFSAIQAGIVPRGEGTLIEIRTAAYEVANG